VEDPSLFPEFDPEAAAPPPAKPAAHAEPLRQVLFGDLHIHTSLSSDAYLFGVRATPDDAYTFARGGTIEHAAGYPIRLSRSLDFAAVTDHAEYLGMVRASEPDVPLNRRSLREVLLGSGPLGVTWTFIRSSIAVASEGLRPERVDPEVTRAAWRSVVEAAVRHDRPGVFTTFIGYEWTSMPGGANLHRNVIYRGTRVPDVPFSSLDSEDPADLWRALAAQAENGMEAIAIPHNGNVSDGRMYARVDFEGRPLSGAYAALRNRMEPVSEIFQVKGSSETHPVLSDGDEFADFELYELRLDMDGEKSEPRGSYARDALRTGLELAHAEGWNPFRFGVIGSSDGHNASSPVEEDRYHGKLPMMDGSAALRLGRANLLPARYNRGMRWSAAGLAAVWAEENTRDALFDAMRRKETYATSGPRMVVRFFGGFGLEAGLLDAEDRVARAYATGVPMGGTLGRAAPGQAPAFVVWALQDPSGAPLDRIQIIEAWVDAAGRSHERIHDVALSDARAPDPATGRVAPVGDTVDPATATFEPRIGAASLRAFWRDDDFDPDRESFYYARVIEIPTPRWSTYDAARLGVPPPDPVSIQERAVTSAIWYDPHAEGAAGDPSHSARRRPAPPAGS
jgi:hypothetical protein